MATENKKVGTKCYCGLKIRGVNHEQGQDHIRRMNSRKSSK